MAVVPQQAVSVGTSAVRLDSAADAPGVANVVPGSRVLIIAQGTGTLVIGGANTVTAINGARLPVVAGTTVAFDLDRGEQLWAIVASGTLAVDVITAGV